MFYAKNCVFFGRTREGGVHLQRIKEYPKPDNWPKAGFKHDDATLSVEFTSTEWASIVASVCHRGETGPTYREALAFHNSDSPCGLDGQIPLGDGRTLVVSNGRITAVSEPCSVPVDSPA